MDSSSPSIPSRPNPKPRNSETGDLMRRSFRASPFPGKTTTGRETSRVEFVDKENRNDKDQISDVVKAPKGVKNFMSPTISAVSKINPSPRKNKILSEKNELSRSFDKTTHHVTTQVRSSVSFSDVVSFIGEEGKDQDRIFISEKKKMLDDVTVTDMMDDSSFDVSSLPNPSSVPFTFPVVESREVDPSVTPYDPKKNYLSPRPQFLHYRPNPRIECKQQLEELFSSDSSSAETDLSAEESQQEEEEVASQQSVEADESQQVEKVASQQSVEEEAKESQQVEKVACEEGVVAVEEEEEHLEAVESEEEEKVVGESTEEAEETHEISKQSRFKASKLLGWILVLGLAYSLLVSSVTLTLPNINGGSRFYEFHIPPEITKSARESFELMGEKLGMWAGSSLVYMDKLISSLREEEGYGPFQFHNLTGVLEDTRLSDTVFQPTSGKFSVGGSLVDSQDWSLEMDTKTENGVHQEPEELESSGEIDLEAVQEESANGFEQESEGGEANSEMATDTEVYEGEVYSESLSGEEESGGQDTDGVEEQIEYEKCDQKNLEEVHEYETGSTLNDEKMMQESESNAYHLHDVESAAISGHQQDEASALSNLESVPEGGIEEAPETNLDISADTSDVDGNDLEEESGIDEEVVVNGEEWKEILLNDQKKVIVLVSTVLVMLAAAAVAAYLLANKKAKPVVHEDSEPTTVSDAKEVTVEHAPVENLTKERLSSLNFQEVEEEVNDDRKREEVSSFPSEMSFSFHKDKSLRSCSNRDDYQSGGGGGKKSNDSGESMASSASEYSIGGSVSYGSFTTYEKIQKKSGRKEEEMVTPVRRSSRIRNHQHSGQ
ncbi:hypothetical protein N665_0844s0027 [Sinapis alba]|nr:hypothetical protein N665_0844s0027 [Sinapis alba]